MTRKIPPLHSHWKNCSFSRLKHKVAQIFRKFGTSASCQIFSYFYELWKNIFKKYFFFAGFLFLSLPRSFIQECTFYVAAWSSPIFDRVVTLIADFLSSPDFQVARAWKNVDTSFFRRGISRWLFWILPRELCKKSHDLPFNTKKIERKICKFFIL